MFALLTQDPAKINYVADPAKAPTLDAFGQLPELASTFGHVDGLFYFTYAVCIFFFVLIVGVLLFSVVKYHRKTFDQPAASNVTHNTPLEVVWTVIPLIIVMVMFAWGFDGCMDMHYAPHAASQNQFKATAKQWSWTFNYPNDPSQSFNEVWIPVDKPVQFVLESTDVLHAFYMPSMRVKRDVIPGRLQTVWFHPKKEGEFHLFCAEYCGDDHSRMYAKVHVVKQSVYDTRPWDQWKDATPAEAAASGESLYKQICASCHSVNGTPSVGPSWKGMFTKQGENYVGRQREVVEGGAKKTITVDDAYITESIQKPDQKKVAEEPYVKNAMTAFPTLEERKIKGLIQYMKSLADAK
ncbi:MAG: cytochrome c oxidase subunit II [Planctomycetes bacterium]|nr:cytochrome c oxidase subunit II [Planctomycetota bacterium]